MMQSSDGGVVQTVVDAVIEQSRRVLETYRIDPGLILEHAHGERRIFQGGYGDRQIFELVQNGADEILEAPGGEIHVVLTPGHLYVANSGNAFTARGVQTILRMGVSHKRGGQIGRFGVGVKSFLSISDSPEFFSVTGSFGFDREWAAEKIRAVHPESVETPVLRIARPYDRERSAAADPVLAGLFKWATTVVRLPLKGESSQRLADDLRQFPAQFLLFAPHVGTVVLEDRRPASPFRRELFAMRKGDVHTIQISSPNQPDVTEKWRVFTRPHTPASAAQREAGELHDRPVIDISWAVPQQNVKSRGEFWAYFPTNYNTTVRGIVNAPWKTSEDRQNLFAGNAFNTDLVRTAADLIVDSLPALVDQEDPGAYIALLPGRGREAAQWADEALSRQVYEISALKPSIPDLDGRLRRPAELQLHPEVVEDSWLALWSGHAGRPADWCHHSVQQRERRAKVELIRSRAGLRTATVREWLEALVADGSAEASARAVKILAAMVIARRADADALSARVVLTSTMGLVAPERGQVFRPAGADALQGTLVYVDPAVAEFDTETTRALETLGIREADAAGRFESVVEQGTEHYTDDEWADFWEFTRVTGPQAAAMALEKHGLLSGRLLKVRTVSGEFRSADRCLLPGVVVPGDGSRDADIAVDSVFHRPDSALLKKLGLQQTPAMNVDPNEEDWFADYLKAVHDDYCKTLAHDARRPHLGSMHLEGASPAGPLGLLTELSDVGKAAFVRHLPPDGIISNWTLRVGSSAARQQIVSPLAWIIRTQGALASSRGTLKAADAVGPALREYGDVLPVAEVEDVLAGALDLADDLESVSPHIWNRVLSEAAVSTDDVFPGRAYALKLRAGTYYPENLPTRCRVGDEWTTAPDEEIAVAADRDEYDVLRHERIPALLAPSLEDAERMATAWKMKRLADVVQRELRYSPYGDQVVLTEEFPFLRIRSGSKVIGWSVQPCSELEHLVRTPGGVRTETLHSATDGQVVLVRKPEDDLGILMAVDRELNLGLGPTGCAGVIAHREKQRDDDRIQRARKAEGEAAKLAALLDAETIKRGLPLGLLNDNDAEIAVSAIHLAELAVDAYGDGLLRQYKDAFAKIAEDGVGDFRGSARSRQFVADLGFPETYAGAKTVTLPEVEHADGPSEYPALHPYQEHIVDAMVVLLKKELPGRAMLCLPTGAGKTRVASEAVIKLFRDGEVDGPILWIAQTQELCEQAVQSWKFVWSKVGPSQRLTMSRLWTTNEATPVTKGPHLVVATDAKLERCLDSDAYTWLRKPAVVIVDEAHASLNPRYTGILKQLGLTNSVTRRPLIGLTATPYRGVNETETRQLVNRYGATRLDEGVFGEEDPYKALQRQGMLAQVEHELLTGAMLTLNDDELRQVVAGALPSSAEQRLAEDEDRNTVILNRVASLPSDWPVLLFAASVNHAQVLTARLNRLGIKSASIDSTTPTPDRRNRIDEFRAGRIRVLTNYGVLAQGFDAPATRVVVVARPTYSPNVYQQMIGRGLRGPRNGGKETCLILNVQDNITNYGEQLAFTAFEHLWSDK